MVIEFFVFFFFGTTVFFLIIVLGNKTSISIVSQFTMFLCVFIYDMGKAAKVLLFSIPTCTVIQHTLYMYCKICGLT